MFFREYLLSTGLVCFHEDSLFASLLASCRFCLYPFTTIQGCGLENKPIVIVTHSTSPSIELSKWPQEADKQETLEMRHEQTQRGSLL